MTKGIFKFQFNQTRVPAIDITNLPSARILKIKQRDKDHLLIEEDQIDEFIQTIRSCQKWLTSR